MRRDRSDLSGTTRDHPAVCLPEFLTSWKGIKHALLSTQTSFSSHPNFAHPILTFSLAEVASAAWPISYFALPNNLESTSNLELLASYSDELYSDIEYHDCRASFLSICTSIKYVETSSILSNTACFPGFGTESSVNLRNSTPPHLLLDDFTFPDLPAYPILDSSQYSIIASSSPHCQEHPSQLASTQTVTPVSSQQGCLDYEPRLSPPHCSNINLGDLSSQLSVHILESVPTLVTQQDNLSQTPSNTHKCIECSISFDKPYMLKWVFKTAFMIHSTC